MWFDLQSALLDTIVLNKKGFGASLKLSEEAALGIQNLRYLICDYVRYKQFGRCSVSIKEVILGHFACMLNNHIVCH